MPVCGHEWGYSPYADGEDEIEHVPPIVKMQRDEQRRRKLVVGFKGIPALESSRETSWSSDSATTTSSSQRSEDAPVRPGKASYLFYARRGPSKCDGLACIPANSQAESCLCPRTLPAHSSLWPANPAQGQFCSPGVGST